MKKRAIIGVISSIIGLFCYLATHFLQIEGDGKEGKVHGDLVSAEVTEPFISHVSSGRRLPQALCIVVPDVLSLLLK